MAVLGTAISDFEMLELYWKYWGIVMRRVIRKCAVTLSAVCVFAFSAQAQNATPSDVLVVLETVHAELQRLYEADGKPFPQPVTKSETPRRPRHVYYKAREVYVKLQTLRWLNGLPRKQLELAPTREIRPTEVRGLSDRILQDLRELKEVYFLDGNASSPAKKSGITPTGPYLALAYASQLIDGLDIPNVVPNDVYRVALAVLADMEVVYQAKVGRPSGVELQSGTTGKSPADVYNAAEALMQAIKDKTEGDEEFTIPAGVTLLEKPGGRLTPTQVLNMMNNLLAELSAVKVKLSATTQNELPPEPSGKNPSNVFDVIQTASTIWSRL